MKFLLESTLVLGIFYGFYWLLFRNFSWLTISRMLIFCLLGLAFVIPMLDWQPKDAVIAEELVEWIPQEEYEEMINASSDIIAKPVVAKWEYPVWQVVYWSIAVILLIRYSFNLLKLFNNENQVKTYKDVRVYSTPFHQSYALFSKIFLSRQNDDFEILEHEYQHVRLGHSYDRLLMDFIVILFWFNPFIYLFRKELIAVHEYQADRNAVRSFDRIAYQQLLLNEARQSITHSMVSYFNVSLTKKRIIMINRNKKWYSLLKVLLVAPLVAGIAVLQSFKFIDLSDIELPAEVMVITETAADNADKNVPSILPVDLGGENVRLSSAYGKRSDPFDQKIKMHHGIDLPAKVGTPVLATADGIATTKTHGENKGYGKFIDIDHGNGFITRYAQLSSYQVKSGQGVKKGELIGFIGSTGRSTAPHLHYEVRKDGKNVDPMNYIHDYELSGKYFQKIQE
jgi:murein DD-endopeptidase MepM/ murein hydrolase activator NlpD